MADVSEATYSQATLEKARRFIAEGGKLSLSATALGLWQVTGFSGITYEVQMTDEGGACSCPSGIHTLPSRCYHSCAVDLVINHIKRKGGQ